MVRFKNRQEAGVQLAAALEPLTTGQAAVFGLPGGGVPVAAEIARHFRLPLDTVVARKIGLPFNPELAIGAVAPGGITLLNDQMVAATHIKPDQLEFAVQTEQTETLERADILESGSFTPRELKLAIVVDDGVATGATAEAALRSLRKLKNIDTLLFAAPVCSPDAAQQLSTVADRVICLETPEELVSVGQWYEEFSHVPTDEVKRIVERTNDHVRDLTTSPTTIKRKK